jgi:hypothetical protein
MLEDIPVQDESDASIRTRGRRTNRSSSSQLPKGSSGSTRRRASAGPATSLTRASEPRGPGQGGQESAVSAVETLQAYGRGSLQAYGRGDVITIDEGESSRADTLQAYGRGDSNADGGGESSRADTRLKRLKGSSKKPAGARVRLASGSIFVNSSLIKTLPLCLNGTIQWTKSLTTWIGLI